MPDSVMCTRANSPTVKGLTIVSKQHITEYHLSQMSTMLNIEIEALILCQDKWACFLNWPWITTSSCLQEDHGVKVESFTCEKMKVCLALAISATCTFIIASRD